LQKKGTKLVGIKIKSTRGNHKKKIKTQSDENRRTCL
jgi:hypothetical protein